LALTVCVRLLGAACLHGQDVHAHAPAPAAAESSSLPAPTSTFPSSIRLIQADGGSDCDADRVAAELGALLRGERLADAHAVALAAGIACAPRHRPRWLLADAVALYLLDDPVRAHALLSEVGGGPSRRLAERAAVLRGWVAWRSRDPWLFDQTLRALPAADRHRLCVLGNAAPTFQGCAGFASADPAAADLVTQYRTAQTTRSPWVAGVASAVLPGAGQVYAGSWQGGAVAFILNAVTFAATFELVDRELYFASALTGLAASVTYVGNIVNAADLARRRNDVAAEEPRARLEAYAVPERFSPADSE
jgi:hypothetical protein